MDQKPNVTITDFMKLDLRVATIRLVEEIPGADKLYKLTLDVGDLGERTICAGLKTQYTADKLLGQKIIIVANLEPRMMRGVLSQGMLLAATDELDTRVLNVHDEASITPGSTVG